MSEKMKRDLKIYTPTMIGQYPFDIAQIYCFEVNSEFTKDRETRLTIMLDDFSKRVLGFDYTVDKPSFRGEILMKCVQRFNTLPQIIVTDNGRDFKPKEFLTFMEQYGIVLINQPLNAHKEKYFKPLISQVQMLLKSTRTTRESICQDMLISSDTQAVSAYPSLNELLNEYFYETYDTTVQVALGDSPRNTFEKGLALSKRLIRLMPSDMKSV